MHLYPQQQSAEQSGQMQQMQATLQQYESAYTQAAAQYNTLQEQYKQVGGVIGKGPWWPESLSYLKKDRTYPSFGMTRDFFFVEKSVSYQKKDQHGHMRPSFFWYDNDSGH